MSAGNTTPNGLWISWNQASASVLAEEYKDAGYWGRHYSTVRMTVGTFFLGVALTILYHQWEKPQLFTAFLVLALAAVGAVLFAIFSYLTFTKMNKQMMIADAFRRSLTNNAEKLEKRYDPLWQPTSLPVGIVLLVLFVVLDVVWAYPAIKGQTAVDTTADGKFPITVQIGQSTPITVDVPIKVKTK
jgi:hypothetical protein